ncbi:hypothetical protein HK102_001635 [Quaeritorhiza haematococci]|nr:hypothetical protein HK102_001635 [Quaeritorhiza haematococci]
MAESALHFNFVSEECQRFVSMVMDTATEQDGIHLVALVQETLSSFDASVSQRKVLPTPSSSTENAQAFLLRALHNILRMISGLTNTRTAVLVFIVALQYMMQRLLPTMLHQNLNLPRLTTFDVFIVSCMIASKFFLESEAGLHKTSFWGQLLPLMSRESFRQAELHILKALQYDLNITEQQFFEVMDWVHIQLMWQRHQRQMSITNSATTPFNECTHSIPNLSKAYNHHARPVLHPTIASSVPKNATAFGTDMEQYLQDVATVIDSTTFPTNFPTTFPTTSFNFSDLHSSTIGVESLPAVTCFSEDQSFNSQHQHLYSSAITNMSSSSSSSLQLPNNSFMLQTQSLDCSSTVIGGNGIYCDEYEVDSTLGSETGSVATHTPDSLPRTCVDILSIPTASSVTNTAFTNLAGTSFALVNLVQQPPFLPPSQPQHISQPSLYLNSMNIIPAAYPVF